MRHQTFDERLNAERALIAAAMENTPPSPRRKLLELMVQQIDAALLMRGWASTRAHGHTDVGPVRPPDSD
jgi:hypothetical protein